VTSAVDELHQAELAGADVARATLRAIYECADRLAALEARVFPPAPAASDPAEIAAQPITTERPQLTGTYEEPAPTLPPAPVPEDA
jgi:hypothetical protein